MDGRNTQRSLTRDPRCATLRIAQEGFKPRKYFSIDRVFRNESVDRTHLAEFHQIEGVICDKGLTLSHLIGVLHEFFRRIGITQVRSGLGMDVHGCMRDVQKSTPYPYSLSAFLRAQIRGFDQRERSEFPQ